MPYPVASTSTLSTTPVSSGCPKSQRTTRCPVHGELPFKNQKRSNARTRSLSLMGGLVGLDSTAIVASTNYRRSKNTHTPKLDISKDINRVGALAWGLPLLSGGKIHQACNKELTKAKLLDVFAQARSFSTPKFIYFGGHANSDGRGFEYFLDNCAEGDQIDPSQTISSTELRSLILGRESSTLSNMVLLTDFCNSSNFLRLPWVLYWDGENYFWRRSGESVSETWKTEQKILHFAGGQPGALTYSFPSTGSLFCREFCNAEATCSERDVSLLERMSMMRDGMRKFCDSYNLQHDKNICQEPQLYASHPFDLHHPASLAELLRSPELLDCCRALDL